jgi:hypothetical protein
MLRVGPAEMLSTDHIKTYIAFGGDIDAWARSDHAEEMNDLHWALIEEIRQGLHLVASGLTSGEFAAQVERRLFEVADSEEVRGMLRALVPGALNNSLQARRP